MTWSVTNAAGTTCHRVSLWLAIYFVRPALREIGEMKLVSSNANMFCIMSVRATSPFLACMSVTGRG